MPGQKTKRVTSIDVNGTQIYDDKRKLQTALIISSLKLWTDSFKFLDDVYHLHDRSNF